jgi:fibro-slime domain-containing protein
MPTIPGMRVDPCALAGNTDPNCEVVHQPGCGDGEVNTANEVCDDGNNKPGDCCSGTCQVEPYCDCSTGTCMSTIICGDGMRGPGEACDDFNATGGDGCSADCHVVEIGYRCPVPGMPCERHFVCGDSIPDPNEGCDDGNAMAGDGCSDRCRMEIGFKCEGAPSSCSPTTCGDSVQEGAESCDDGNMLGFDGCSPDCRAEPVCVTGEACTSSCGDGIVFGNEACDDGNLRPGDGCSATCTQEEGYVCNNNAPCITRQGVDPATGMLADICTLTVPAIFRDFISSKEPRGGHPDFQPGFNSAGAVQGLVEDMLDAEGKPVQRANLSMGDLNDSYLHGPAPFAQWYRESDLSSDPIPGQILLWDNTRGGYVNRWGAMGEQWKGPAGMPDYGTPVYGGPAGSACDGCTLGPNQMCYDPCTPWGNSTDSCCGDIAVIEQDSYDGNPLFFPLDNAPGMLNEPASEGKVPAQYGWGGWPWETDVAMTLGVAPPIATSTADFPSTTHNYSFTTEVKYWFLYTADLQATLDFTGDDDLWVFLNGHLAVDMGGWHVPTNGTLTIDGAAITTSAQTNADDAGVGPIVRGMGTAAQFGLQAGNVYQIAVFHAERQKEGSSFKLTLSGFNANPSDCRTNCGDGMVGPGEECDDGTNRGAYNECAPECVLGPRCGDAVLQTDYGEECDDGVNAGTYGGCGPDCKPGPHCGDAVVQAADGEQCDDGQNAGNYGGCDQGCVIGPHCGDGFITIAVNPETNQPYEGCDDGNTISDDGCSNCLVDIVVPK